MDSNSPQRPHGLALVLHSLAPTATSLLAYLIVGALITGIHLIALSVSGTAYPTKLDDELLAGYTNFIIQPLLVLANHPLASSAATLAVWAVAGTITAAALGAAASVINNWRNTRDDISVPRYGVVIRHPLQHHLVMRLLWRLCIGALIVVYTAGALTVIRFCLANDLALLDAASLLEVGRRFALSTLIWAAVFHGYVILLRLFVLRTRIFGEILY